MRRPGIWILLSAVALLGVTPLVADTVIGRGIDVFTTTAAGTTFYDFADDPIPAGFFCPTSPAFTGRVVFRGLPVETKVPGQLRGADTVIERLDDAVFDANGVATTRIKVRALSLISVEPLHTPCGDFHVYVSLAEKQRATTMEIRRTRDTGGTFVAPLDIRTRMTFVPTKGRTEGLLQLEGHVRLPSDSIPWSFSPGPGVNTIGSVVADTDGDLVPETHLAGTSNFAPGWDEADLGGNTEACFQCEPEICHANSGHEHCTGPVLVCSPAVCP